MSHETCSTTAITRVLGPCPKYGIFCARLDVAYLSRHDFKLAGPGGIAAPSLTLVNQSSELGRDLEDSEETEYCGRNKVNLYLARGDTWPESVLLEGDRVNLVDELTGFDFEVRIVLGCRFSADTKRRHR